MKNQLEAIVAQFYKGGCSYANAVLEFKKCFISTVLRENRGNQIKAARELGIHRNSLRRTITQLEVDVAALRSPARRPPKSERPTSAYKRMSR